MGRGRHCVAKPWGSHVKLINDELVMDGIRFKKGAHGYAYQWLGGSGWVRSHNAFVIDQLGAKPCKERVIKSGVVDCTVSLGGGYAFT